jgi:hypothetical protein
MPQNRSWRSVAAGTLLLALSTSPLIAQAGVTRRAIALDPTALARNAQPVQGRYGSPLLIAGQIVAGSLSAAGAGFLSWAAYNHPNGADRRVRGDAGYTPNANTAYALGSFAGAVAATHLVGRIDGSRGNLLGTVIGAAIPTIPLFLGRDDPYLPIYGVLFAAPAQALGGMLGDQLTRRR